jgi:hypothetical protein
MNVLGLLFERMTPIPANMQQMVLMVDIIQDSLDVASVAKVSNLHV